MRGKKERRLNTYASLKEHQSVKNWSYHFIKSAKKLSIHQIFQMFSFCQKQLFTFIPSVCQQFHIMSVHQKWDVINTSINPDVIKASNCQKSSKHKKFRSYRKSSPWWQYGVLRLWQWYTITTTVNANATSMSETVWHGKLQTGLGTKLSS